MNKPVFVRVREREGRVECCIFFGFVLLQHKTIDSVLERGEKLDSLVEKSSDLSMASQVFVCIYLRYCVCSVLFIISQKTFFWSYAVVLQASKEDKSVLLHPLKREMGFLSADLYHENCQGKK